MSTRLIPGAALVAVLAAASASRSTEPELAALLDALRGVGAEGSGNAEASKAWRRIVEQSDAGILPRLLEAMDDSSPLAANWIRGAVDAVAERSLTRGGKLPGAALERFAGDRSHDPRARRLAFEWLERVDPGAADRLIPGMLDDPGVEFRRDAVDRLFARAEEIESDDGKRAELQALYRKALDAARDPDQIKRATKWLRDQGVEVDLPRHFGFLMRWKLIGPFDNRDKRGFDAVYPPERRIDTGAVLQGKNGPVRWIDHVSDDDYGKVDLNRSLGREKGVVGYALHEFTADAARDVEFRLATVNAWKLWLNGKPLWARDEYHHGTQIDHYRVKARLEPGANLILLKVCQNEQTQDYADPWMFQIRVCDATGTAVLSRTRADAGEGSDRAGGNAAPPAARGERR